MLFRLAYSGHWSHGNSGLLSLMIVSECTGVVCLDLRGCDTVEFKIAGSCFSETESGFSDPIDMFPWQPYHSSPMRSLSGHANLCYKDVVFSRQWRKKCENKPQQIKH